MRKIKILGAGLSGMSAAINLAKAGYEVEMFEKNPDSGMRFHGDMQGLENWSSEEGVMESLAKMHIDADFEFTPFYKVSFSNMKETKEFSYNRPLFYLVKRGNIKGSIDQAMKKQALDIGIKINYNKTIDKKKADIVATGPQFKHLAIADKGVVFKTDLPDMAVGLINDKAAYKGYGYLLVANGYGCLCTCIFDDLKRLDDCYNVTEKFFTKKYKFKINNSKPVGGVGYFTLRNIFTKGKTFYVGEAAGLQDFLAGFGMRTAIRSGYLAAKSIIEKTDYAKIADDEFGDYRKAGIINRYIWEHIDIDNYLSLLKSMNQVSNTTNFIRNVYDYSLIKSIEYPIALSYIKKQYPEVLE